MNGYICIKSLTLGGIAYNAGEAIPAEAVLPNRVRALAKQGYIAPQNETTTAPQEPPQSEPPTPAPIVLPITKDGGVLELVAAPSDIIQVVSILQLKVEEAAKAVVDVESEEALILIDALETRKTVRTAIQAKAEAMQKASEEKDNEQEEQKKGDA